MRILSVVTLISPDGAYGGPVRVAVNQARALIEAGHQVTVAAATRGFIDPPTAIDQVPVRLFPARTILPGTGFAGLGAPALTRWVRDHLADFDVVHLHLARDLVTLPVAAAVRRAGLPYFVQSHGMIDPSRNPLAGPLDALVTRRVLRDAAAVFHLTNHERDQLRLVAGELRFVPLANGVPEAAQAPAGPTPAEVLYLARLAPRKRPLEFIAAASALTARFPDTRFRLVGPDEGEGPAVRAAIEASAADLDWEGPLAPEHSLARMAQASIYVLPSVAEPYPMSVLEALSIGRPVVITSQCGLADFVRDHQAGRVCEPDVESLVQAITELLSDPQLAEECGRNGRRAVQTELTMTAIADRLAAQYRAALPA
ncbi:MAG: glycosyltransferase [Actinobacteria bacterium HGW-Actinobacteria-2]|nr:MAG: glycosyltransferase [Actinobacteria bacterium HGW-Actinobacteria-2]